MPLPHDYAAQVCAIARSLEIVGERWTLLIVRDAFWGVRRFGDFVANLDIPRAVLTDRLRLLVDEDVLERVPGETGRHEYVLTAKGRALWPVLYSLINWGNDYYSPAGNIRQFFHASDEGTVRPNGRCDRCGIEVPVHDLVMSPAAGSPPPAPDARPVTRALAEPHRLMEPLL